MSFKATSQDESPKDLSVKGKEHSAGLNPGASQRLMVKR